MSFIVVFFIFVYRNTPKKINMEWPPVFSKSWLAYHYFNVHPRWIRRNIFTDAVIEKELQISVKQYKKYKTFPPDIASRIKSYIKTLQAPL